MNKHSGDAITEEEAWLARLANLNVDRSGSETRGCAPHKPLLLLVVLDMIQEGALSEPAISRDAELSFRFQNYWTIVALRRGNRGDIRMPFHALGPQRDQIWVEMFTLSGETSTSRDTTYLVKMHSTLWQLCQDQAFRDRARSVLIGTYFPADEQVSLCTACGLPIPEKPEIATLKELADVYLKSQEIGRSTRFRGQVVSAYLFTCALTGYCLTTVRGTFIVEAAHIHALSRGGSNDPTNGLALTPNSHWMFDEGLWSVSPQGQVIVAGEHAFKDVPGADGFQLRQRHGQALHFDPRALLRPSNEFLAWHRKEVFLK